MQPDPKPSSFAPCDHDECGPTGCRLPATVAHPSGHWSEHEQTYVNPPPKKVWDGSEWVPTIPTTGLANVQPPVRENVPAPKPYRMRPETLAGLRAKAQEDSGGEADAVVGISYTFLLELLDAYEGKA